MPQRKNLPLLIIIILILSIVPAFLAPRPAAARVELDAGRGEAVWFFRTCVSDKAEQVAAWAVDLNPSATGRNSINIQVRNAYPGYQLRCDLYFANTGKIPLSVKGISVTNSNPGDLVVSAQIAPGEQPKVIKSCGSKPAWGKNPAALQGNCRSIIKLVLTIGPQAQEKSVIDFTVRVRLEEKPDLEHP